MTAREARKQRRAAERKQQKLAARQAAHAAPAASPRTDAEPEASLRAETNRLNAQRSTGPRTAEGKARSSRNAFKHGIYSREIVIPGEDPAEFEYLRNSLRAEHQPANSTEEILVNELAEQFWRLRRMRALESRAFQPENLDDWMDNGLLALIQRTMASAERGFHKSLAALTKLQRERGFVPQKQEATEGGFVPREEDKDAESSSSVTGFVPPIALNNHLVPDYEPIQQFGTA